MTELVVGGEAFNVRVEGEEGAPALMLAHPLGANLHVFDPIMPALLQHFRVLRYDARGHGASTVTPGPYSLDRLGRDALAIMDVLKIEKVDWIGVSKGAAVGLWLLVEAPQRVGRAVLANVTAHFGSRDIWNERIRTVREEGMERLAPSILENWFTRSFRERHPEELNRIREMLLAAPPEGYAAACAALRDMDLREAVREIRQPVLVIVGRHDSVTTPGHGALVASAIPNARLVTLETAHMSCVEDPAGFSRAALDFLTAEERAMGEETQVEASQEAPSLMPAKKPRKPRSPKKSENGSAEVEVHVAPTATAVPELEPESEPAQAPEPETVPDAAAPSPLPPARKPRPRRVAAAPKPETAAPSVASISVSAPQPRKRPARKAAAKKAASKKAPAKRAAAKRAAAKKSGARTGAAKKSAMRKTRAAAPARKAVAKKTVAKKAVAKKSVAKKAAGKRALAKKAATKKAPMRKAAMKKAAVRKAVVKKTQAKKSAMKKAPARKGASRKGLPRRRPGARKR